MKTYYNLVVSSTHNYDAMRHAVKWVAENVINYKGAITLGLVNQVKTVIRAYDPCHR